MSSEPQQLGRSGGVTVELMNSFSREQAPQLHCRGRAPMTHGENGACAHDGCVRDLGDRRARGGRSAVGQTAPIEAKSVEPSAAEPAWGLTAREQLCHMYCY